MIVGLKTVCKSSGRHAALSKTVDTSWMARLR